MQKPGESINVFFNKKIHFKKKWFQRGKNTVGRASSGFPAPQKKYPKKYRGNVPL